MSIEVRNISKDFGEVKALKNVTLSFGGDKIYGLLGRNGAGKTTLMNIISGRLLSSSGEVYIDGKSLKTDDGLHSKVFMTGDESLYPDGMRVREIFKWAGDFDLGFDRGYAEELSKRFKLDTRRKYKNLSTGFRSIVKLVAALASDTPYLILDEPVLGLDANNRDLFYKALIERYSDKPRTIILSTHLIEEVSGIVEDVAIIKDGEIIRCASRDELLACGFSVSGPAAAVESYIEGREVLSRDRLGGLMTACVIGKPGEVPEGLEISRLDLQRMFIQLTNS